MDLGSELYKKGGSGRCKIIIPTLPHFLHSFLCLSSPTYLPAVEIYACACTVNLYFPWLVLGRLLI